MAKVERTFTSGADADVSSWKLQAHVVDLSKPPNGAILSTGVGFLNHMLDQFNSHAQIGISVVLHKLAEKNACTTADHHGSSANQFATQVNQTQLFAEIGTLLGTEFHRILLERSTTTTSSSFGCPLDEALVLVELQQQPSEGSLDYDLEPYGAFPPVTGRTHLGQMELKPLEAFWNQVAQHSKLSIKFQKIRGENAHHIVEASFKAFSRALRNLVDGMDTEGDNNQVLYGPESLNAQASIALHRQASVERNTKETSIVAGLRLDGGLAGTSVSMGLRLLDEFWAGVSREAWASLQVQCKGDLWIDEHHTAEDVAIALGQVWNISLGDKAGLNRMWSCASVQSTARVKVILDLSNRPMLTHNLPLLQHPTDLLQDVPVEMLEHVLDSFVVNARMTLQIYVTPTLEDTAATLEDAWSALAVALGRAIRYCIMVDQRRAGATASSKGTLSV